MHKTRLLYPAVTFFLLMESNQAGTDLHQSRLRLFAQHAISFFMTVRISLFFFILFSLFWMSMSDRRVRRRIIRGTQLSSITSHCDGIRLKRGLMRRRRSLHQRGDCKLVGMRWTAANLLTLQRSLQAAFWGKSMENPAGKTTSGAVAAESNVCAGLLSR